MDETKVDRSQSPTPEDLSRPLKRQKIETSDSLNLSTSGNASMQKTDGESVCEKKYGNIYSILLEIEADEKLLGEENEQLKIQIQLDTCLIARLQGDFQRSEKDREETIAQLEGNLENLIRDLEQARRVQKYAEFKLSQLKIIIKQRIMPLVMNPSFEDTLTASYFQEEDQEESAPGALAKVTSRNYSISQKKLNTQDVAIQTIIPEIPTDGEREALEAKVNRVDELEKELQMARATISSLHEVRSQQRSSMQETIDEAERVQQQMKILEKNFEMLSSKIDEVELMQNTSSGGDMELANSSGFSLVAPDHSSTLLDQCHNEADGAQEASSPDGECDVAEESSGIPVDEDIQTDGPSKFVGRKRSVLVTSSKFFELNWNDEFTRTKEKEWVCKRCFRSYTSKQYMEDHVWSVHHGGKFQCPHCTHIPRCFPSRRATMLHITREHAPPDQGHNDAQEMSAEEFSPSNDEPDVDKESSMIPEGGGQRASDSQMWIGRKYSILTSPAFFNINWNEEFSQAKSRQFVCKTCVYSIPSIEIIKDHVWNVHYSGIFKCPHCANSRSYICRQSVRNHIKMKHQNRISLL